MFCRWILLFPFFFFFFFNDTATTEIYTLSLHDALPIWSPTRAPRRSAPRGRIWAKTSARWWRIAWTSSSATRKPQTQKVASDGPEHSGMARCARRQNYRKPLVRRDGFRSRRRALQVWKEKGHAETAKSRKGATRLHRRHTRRTVDWRSQAAGSCEAAGLGP